MKGLIIFKQNGKKENRKIKKFLVRVMDIKILIF